MTRNNLQPQLSAFAVPPSDKRVGLIAGWGRYPILVAEHLTQLGYEVFCLGIAGHADAALADACDDYRRVGLTRLGAQIRYFRRHGIQDVTMAGKIHKVLLFNRDFLWQNLPDLVCIRTFFPHYISRSKDRSDDSLLGAVVNSYSTLR